jgi:hypothetical protein
MPADFSAARPIPATRFHPARFVVKQYRPDWTPKTGPLLLMDKNSTPFALFAGTPPGDDFSWHGEARSFRKR